MHRRVFEQLNVAIALATVALMSSAVPAAAQAQGQSREQIQEAARKASPRTGDEAMKFFEKDVEEAMARAAARVWDPEKPLPPSPRTPWGAPDLRGYYLSLSYTPLERPNGVTKALYTPEEAIEAFKKAAAEDAEVDPATVHYDWKEFGMDMWQSPVRPSRRTALITDPPDGKIPALSPEGQKRRAAAAAAAKVMDPQASVSTLPNLYTRCITGNQGPPRLPFNHDSESQIVQTPGYVIILTQSNNDARIIPLDGRPHLEQNVKAWLGDARGRWEGDTLVVETTNFNPGREWRGSSSGMNLVERFRRVDEKTLKYEFTVTDPTTWSKPWTVENIWPAIEPPIYEFACHEQNYGVINVVAGAQIRATEGGGRGQGGPGGGAE